MLDKIGTTYQLNTYDEIKTETGMWSWFRREKGDIWRW